MVMDCKLCLKRFSNGKALGAHMRSHYAILPLPPKTHQQLTDPPTTTDEKQKQKQKQKQQPPPPKMMMKKKKKKRQDPDPEFFESGSTRARGFAELGMEEDDVALCLIMLSRDVWRNSNSDSDSGSEKKIFRCDKCYKVFKTSQGLGSHKATHFKKMKMNNPIPFPECSFQERENDHQLLHECALCPRIFKSAQALGGHKRSHFPAAGGTNLVDLNLPPPALLHSSS